MNRYNVQEKQKLHDNPKLGGENWIYYGAPGCGKSFKIKSDLKYIDLENQFRVTFHPEYTNSDFVGQIMPAVSRNADGSTLVEYKFNAGPFTKALEKALTTNDAVYLIIEEINRGNAAAIFGDLFQLLDRQKAKREDGSPNPLYGKSEYEISNPNVEEYLKENIDLPSDYRLYIPSNMFIWATMNSSDQNVFTLDTAFKRRWYFEHISNDIAKDTNHRYKNYYVPGTDVTWENFLLVLNPAILDYKIKNHTNEDKQLGKYFVGENCLCKDINADIKDEAFGGENSSAAKQFAHKVLEYLWNDVCKIDKDTWFDTSKYRTLEELIDGFTNPEPNKNPLSVFKIDFGR